MYNPYQGGYQGGYQQGGGFQGQYGFQGQQQQPYMQQQQTGFYQQNQPQQPGLFQGQQTGFQPQQTGFQPQQTGFQQQFPQQTPQLNQQATGFQPQQTGFNSGYNQPLTAQKTGFSAALGSVTENTELKIPSIRLSFISAEDQTKFEHLFRTAVPKGENSISGDGARDILLRSGLQPVTLAEIWTLADTNKSGALLFPEFALALHLCNMSLKNEPLPGVLPERWQNEVQSFVDAISFSVPEDPNKIMANTPFSSFAAPKPSQSDWLDNQPVNSNFSGNAAPPPTSFTAQPTGGLNSLTAQRTGGGSFVALQPQQTAGLVPAQPLQSQRTGPLQQQATGFQQQQQQQQQQPQLTSQRTGPSNFQPQQTGLQPQGTGFNGSQGLQQQRTGGLQQQRTGGFQPQQTGGFQPQQTGGFQPQPTGGFQPQQTGGLLQSQPTGKPGQWGFVHTPTGGIPGLNVMEQHFLPNAQMNTNNLQNAMGGTLKSNVTWAITKQEKSIYDGIFGAWDPERKGFIQGDTAIGIFNKSGLSRPDLESIWNLCDAGNRGKLNKDEFAVAMHLVYRRLNGLEIPLRLPPELIPPSAKYLQDSVDSLKNSLKGGSKGKPQAAKPPTSASRFRNNDDDMGYVSNSRHRSRRPAEEQPSSVQSSKSRDLTTADLKKLIREKQILLDAVNAEDQHSSIANKQSDDYNSRLIEGLKTQIRDTESKLSKVSLGGSQEEKTQLLEKLNHFTKDKVPSLIQRIHKVNQDLARTKTEVAKAKLKKEYPDWTPEAGDADIVGTGPNGEVTDTDRRKHKSKALLRQRMAALTGKSVSDGTNKDADQKLKQISDNATKECESESSMIKDIETSIKDLEDGAALHLQVSVKDQSGSEKWESGIGVSHAVKVFLDELKKFEQKQSKPQGSSGDYFSGSEPASQTAPSSSSSRSSAVSSPAAHKTPEERQAYIKEQAQKRMNERLAKLGLSRKGQQASQAEASSPKPASPKPVETPKAPEPAPSKPEPQQPKEAPKAPEPAPSKPEPQQPKEAPKAPEPEKQDESSDDDDEEYAALLKQKQELEAKKLKKKQEKEARLAKLKKEMADMEGSSDEEAPAPAKAYTPSSNKPTPTTEAPKAPEPPAEAKPEEPKKEESSQAANGPHKSNPFARFGTDANKGAEKAGTPGSQNSNPFFKSQQKQEPVDQKRMEAQRASQRGLGSDDWSDEEANSSDDDEPNRAGAAKLASLLFGGMPQPVTRNPTGNPAAQEQKAPEPAQAAEKQAEPQAPQQPPSAPAEAPPAPAEAPPVPAEAPPAPSQAPPAPAPPAQAPPAPVASTQNDDESSEFDSDSTDEFATPSPPSRAADLGADDVPPVPGQAPPPPIPQEAPPVPSAVPPIPQEAPPVPSQAPPPPSGGPPPPPLPAQAPPAPSGGAPPPPPSFLSSPPPPPPDLGGAKAAGPPSGGAPNIGALLGQIQGGKSLKKLDDSQKKVADGATVGRVL
ncbi:hypothetical protein CA3LBN_001150 [Candidozyma haemuli]|uniref:Actin cytoskeleton-regulatory complex protein PAN1 n=1 Tax=Candidozyma haemuli TaxID=45357 RepID=A0ABX8I1U0_9ASCO|nr:hypothetical protein CA3LBN_001150 [[Candida] haemuloni]